MTGERDGVGADLSDADGPATIPALLAAAVAAHGDHAAVVDGGTRLTYRELADEAGTFGAALVAAGVDVGDRVAPWAPNSARWIISVLGLWRAGAVLVPINTRFKGAEAAEILDRSGAKALITVTDFLGVDYVEALRTTGADLPALGTTVVIDGPVPDGATGWSDQLAKVDDGDRAEVDRRSAALGPDDVSDILFTSGTTGHPKGVVQTHGRTLVVARDWVSMTGLAAGDRYLMVNPYFHMFGLKAGILASVVAGATMYPESTFDPERAMARIASESITVLPGAPTIYQALLDHPARGSYDLSSLRLAVTGAAEIPVELIRRVLDELPFTVVISGYGLTEAGTAIGHRSRRRPGDDRHDGGSTPAQLRAADRRRRRG